MILPCDACMWGLIPMIKRELVLKMYKENKITKAEIARKLSITKSAVTQYIQGKRATDSKKLRKIKPLDKAISKLAKEISEKSPSEKAITKTFCEICKLAQKKTGTC